MKYPTTRSVSLALVLWTLPGLVACGSDSEGESSSTSTSSGKSDASTDSDDADDGNDPSSDDTPSDDDGPSQTGSVDGSEPSAPGSETDDAPGNESPDPSDTMDAGSGSTPTSPVQDGAVPDFVEIATNPDGTIEVLCGSEPCACSDGMDNDGDGLTDGADSECTGPFDHDETTFATGIPGDNRDPKWQDCFFDGNSGAGDDDCRYHSDCLTGDLPEDDPDCQVTAACQEYCQPLTPPGCDCFGCCDVTTEEGETVHILVGETCSLSNIDDEAACPRCEPTSVCANECGECEICVGMTVDDLPESCWPEPDPPTGAGGSTSGAGGSTSGAGGGPSNGAGGSTSGAGGSTNPPDEPTPPPNTCDGGLTACFDSDDCAATEYCSLGCCKPTFQVR